MGNVMEETWSPEPVKAWRYWHIPERFWNFDNHRWEATLHGQMEPWESAIKFAEHKELFESHPCPEPGCGCGINAVKSLTWKDISGWLGFCTCGTCEGNHHSMLTHNPVAVGEVALSGIVDEYEFGYRAEQAEILRLVVIAEDRRIAETIEVCYGVPVSWETPTGPLVAQLWKEHQNGYREADTSDHRGTGTGQDTGTSEGTRKGKRTLISVGWAGGTSAWYTLGLGVVMSTESLWRWPLLTVIFSGGAILLRGYAKSLKRQ